MTNTVLQIRVPKGLKEGATLALNNIGLDMSTAIRLFLKNVEITKTIPFSVNDTFDTFRNEKVGAKRIYKKEDLTKYMSINTGLYDDVSIDDFIKEGRRDRF